MKGKIIAIGVTLMFLIVGLSGCIDNEELESIKSELVELQSQYESLESNNSKLQSNYSYLQSDYSGLQSIYNTLQSQHEQLNYSYNELQNTYEIYNAELYNEIPFVVSLSGGDVYEERLFDIGYGIIMKVVLDVKLYDKKIWQSIFWTRGGESGVLTSGCRTYQQLPSTLKGSYYCEIFDDGGNQISAYAGIRSNQSSWSGRNGNGNFPKVLD